VLSACVRDIYIYSNREKERRRIGEKEGGFKWLATTTRIPPTYPSRRRRLLQNQRWTGPSTRPGSCPLYSAFYLYIYISFKRAFFLLSGRKGILLLARSARLNSIENWKKARTLLTLYFLSLLILIITNRNIVATVNLDCKLDLKTIAFHARNVEYNPKV